MPIMAKDEEKTRKSDPEVTAGQKLAYYVLLYHEGCTLIPSTWVNINKRTYVWPAKPILSRPKMHQMKPDDTWASLEYTKHVGPYDTFQEALKVEEITATNISSTEDSEAIENAVNDIVHGKKRFIKPTVAYSPTDDKPPHKYIVRNHEEDPLGKRSQDTDTMPPSKYVVEATKQDKTRAETNSDSPNEEPSSDPKNAESPVTMSKPGTGSQKNEPNPKNAESPVTTPKPGTSSQQDRHKSSAKKSGKGAMPFHDLSTESNGSLPSTPIGKKKRKRKHDQKSNKKGSKPYRRRIIVYPETSDEPNSPSIEEESKFDDGTEKPLRVYKKMKGEKVIPHQLLNPTSNENGEYHSQAENNVIAVSNDIEKDEEMVHRNTEREAHSEAEDRHDRTPKTSNKFKTSNEQPKASSHRSPKGIRDGKQHSPQKEKTVRIGQQRLNSRILQSQDNVCAHCRSPCCAKFSTLLILLIDKVNILLGGRMENEGLGEEDNTSVLPKFPLENMVDLRAFDRLLSVEKAAQEEFKRTICMIGGRNIKKFVKNVLEFLLTDKLAKKYTWTGIRNTNKVKDMKFISLIKEALVVKVKGTTKDDVLHAAQEWFRRAGDRIRLSTEATAK